MRILLVGFRQERDMRQFAFRAIAEDGSRREITVEADLTLVRKLKIPLQELPMLCRKFLEGNIEALKLVFTEQDMLAYTRSRAAAALTAELKRQAKGAHFRKSGPAPFGR